MKLELLPYKQKITQLWRWLVKKDFIIFLLFVGLVSIVWWGRSMSSSLDGNLQVQLNYSGVDERISFATPLPTLIQVSVRDNGKQLRQLSKRDLTLNLNLASYFTNQNGTMTLTAETLRSRLQDILPGSTIILRIDPEVISAQYTINDYKKVPVLLMADIECAPQHQLKFQPLLSQDSIYIYGSHEALSTIHHIHTDSVHVNGLQDSLTQMVKLAIPTSVYSIVSEVQMTCQAEPYTDKSLTLPIRVLNTPHGRRLRLFPATTTVMVRVGISQFDKVKEDDLKAVCYYPKQHTDGLTIEIQTNNPYVSNIRCTPAYVEYIIERL